MSQSLSKANKSWISDFIGGLPLYKLEEETASPQPKSGILKKKISLTGKVLPTISAKKPKQLQPQFIKIDIASAMELAKSINIQTIQIIGVPGGATIRPGIKVAPLTWEIEKSETPFIELRVGLNKYQGLNQIQDPSQEGRSGLGLLFKIVGQELEGQGQTVVYKSNVHIPYQILEQSSEFSDPIVLTKPILESESKPEPEFVTLAKQGSDKIIVRLGIVPSRGDPNYQIYIDDYQVATGKVDWSRGIDAVDLVKIPAIIWQDIEISWNFDILMPSIVAVSYEEESGGQNHNIAIEYIEVNGIRIDDDGHNASFPGGRKPFAGHLDYESLSWAGDVIFNVSRAMQEAQLLLESVSHEDEIAGTNEATIETVDVVEDLPFILIEGEPDQQETSDLEVDLNDQDHTPIVDEIVLQAISREEGEIIRADFIQKLIDQVKIVKDHKLLQDKGLGGDELPKTIELQSLMNGENIREEFYKSVMKKAKTHLER